MDHKGSYIYIYIYEYYEMVMKIFVYIGSMLRRW